MPDDADAGDRRPGPRWRLVGGLIGAGGAAGALAMVGDVFPDAPFLAVLLGGAASGVLGTVSEILRVRRTDPGPESTGSATPGAPAVLRERLPLRSAHFTGRDAALSDILDRFRRFPAGRRGRLPLPRRRAAAESGPLVVAVTGDGGTGKTELVNQIVDRVEHRFPDGKLEFELYGDRDDDGAPGAPPPGGPGDAPGLLRRWWRARGEPARLRPARRGPRRPERVLVQLLTEVGAAPHGRLGLDELAARWRTVTRHRRLLLVLDNARDFAQVEPLLPKGPGCAVLITSRNAFAAAPTYVHRHPLPALSTDEGERLLRRITGSAGAARATDPEVLRSIVAHCYGLPLALCWCGSRLAEEDGPPADRLLARLREDTGRHLLGPAGITAAFADRFAQCAPRERLLLARVARTGLTTFTPWAAAALLDAPTRETAALLEDMSDRYLVVRLHADAAAGPRYQLHEYVRAILQRNGPRDLDLPAAEHAAWSDDAFAAAVDRLLTGYAWLAEHAARAMAPREWGFDDDAPPRPAPSPRLDLAPPPRPEAWLHAERRSLWACLDLARDRGDVRTGWRLARSLTALCRGARAYWDDWRAAGERASALALRLGDRWAYGVSLLERAEIAGGQGDHGAAVVRARAARLVLSGGDERWAARAARALGVNLYRRGDRDDGEVELRRAERVFARHGERLWHARTLANLGELHRFRGDYARARGLLAEARARFDAEGDTGRSATSRLLLGDVLGHMGRDLDAWLTLRDALDRLDRDDGGTWYRARCLRALGRLDPARLRRQYDTCDLLLDPARERERREAVAEYVWRRSLGSPTRVRARAAELGARWYREHADRARDLLGGDHWAALTTTADGGTPRWSGEGPDRLRADHRGWSRDANLALVEEAYALLEQVGDAWGRYRTLLVLGELRVARDPERARRDMEAAAEGFARLGDRWWHARALRRTAEVLFDANLDGPAEAAATRAYLGYQGLSNLSGQLRAQVLLGKILHRSGKDHRALVLLDDAGDRARAGLRDGLVPRALHDEVRHVTTTILGEPLDHPTLGR
jgi:hypothetical protein